MSKSWSIHTRPEIISKYQIQERVGSGAYADVYKARRLSDSLVVALKEIHDYQSAFREIEALQILQSCPNIVVLHEYFWSEDEDAVLVLEYLPTDMASVIREAKKEWPDGLTTGETKRWIIQILCGVDSCHRNSILHRDLKPSNLLISSDGVLKLADFGQARKLLETGFVAVDDNTQQCEESAPNQSNVAQPPRIVSLLENAWEEDQGHQEQVTVVKEEVGGELSELGSKSSLDQTDKEINIYDGNTSCVATCTSRIEDDPFKSSYSFEAEADGKDGSSPLTLCVGTRWFRAPELLLGCTKYGPDIDLWSLGCIFAELFSLQPLFPGTSDIDQLSRIFSVLGNLTEEIWPGCLLLPDYKTIAFGKVENPVGVEACLPSCSANEILLVKKLLCFDPASRATAMELLHDKYLNEEPLPVPISELRVPSKHSIHDESPPSDWGDYGDLNSNSDFDEFGPLNVKTTNTGFSIQFP